jgi:hypothetical protein
MQYKQTTLVSTTVQTRNSQTRNSETRASDARTSWMKESLGRSAAATLIELGSMLAAADASDPKSGVCIRCSAPSNSQRSNAQYANTFCSKECEQEFVRTAMASVTLQECLRIQHRLETLLTDYPGAALKEMEGDKDRYSPPLQRASH